MKPLYRSLVPVAAAFWAASFTGCATTAPKEKPKGPVALQLEAKAAETREMLPPEALVVIDQTNIDLEDSGIADAAKQVGDKAVSFVLPDSQGNSTSLDALLLKGPVVLTFYRGHW